MQQRGTTSLCQGFPHQQVAVAMQQINPGATLCEAAQSGNYPGMKFIFQIIIARSAFKQVAKDIQRFRLRREFSNETLERRHAAGMIGAEMQVGNKQGVGHNRIEDRGSS